MFPFLQAKWEHTTDGKVKATAIKRRVNELLQERKMRLRERQLKCVCHARGVCCGPGSGKRETVRHYADTRTHAVAHERQAAGAAGRGGTDVR
jgi:hypothetical protein